MVVALFALALAMIAGGLTAVVQGYEIVLLERGWTLVISGSVFASGGALLLGLAMAVARLGKIQAELVKAGERAGHAEHALPAAPAFEPLAATSAGLLDGGAAGGPSGSSGDADGDQPALPLFMRREPEDREPSEHDGGPPPLDEAPEPVAKPAAARNDNHGPKLTLPRYLFGRRNPEPDTSDTLDLSLVPPEPNREPDEPSPRRHEESRAVPSDGDEGLPTVRPDDGGAPVAPLAGDEPEGARTIVSPLPQERAESEPDDGATPETSPDAGPPATIIGSYNSGDNRYVMFSDGSIEADTPDGVFRFASLDELKDFIASGGEGGARRAT